jgi:hypothetical protein
MLLDGIDQAELPHPIKLSSKRQVLLVNTSEIGHSPPGSAKTSFAGSSAQGSGASLVDDIIAKLKRDKVPYEALGGNLDYATLIRLLLSGDFTVCIIVGFGINGPGIMRDFGRDDLRLTFTSWVSAGGRLVTQGEGCLGNLINLWFNKSWYFCAYETAKSDLVPDVAVTFASSTGGAASAGSAGGTPTAASKLPKSIEVRSHALENVEESSQLYRYVKVKNLCTVAVSPFGAGRLAFVGAVDSSPAVVQIVDALVSSSY